MNKEEKAAYDKQWYQDTKEHHDYLNHIWRTEHPEYSRKYSKEYCLTHVKETHEYRISRNKQRRIILLNIISNNNPYCIRCGCDDIRLLEINHKNGGGNQELQTLHNNSRSSKFLVPFNILL
jgi:hypothetical protein